MLDDAAVLEGRHTKRKWKTGLALVLAALALLGAAWTAGHWSTVRDAWCAFLPRHDLQTKNVWVSGAYGREAQAFALGDLVIFAGTEQISAVELDGTIRYRCDRAAGRPVSIHSRKEAAVYTPGGTELILLDSEGARTLSVPSGIDAAAVSDCGSVAVITSGSGYQTVTKQYNEYGDAIAEQGRTDSAMVMMTYIRRGDLLAACLIGMDGAWRLRIGTEEFPLAADTVYDIKPCGDGVALWTNEGLLTYSAEGTLTGRLGFRAEELIAWDSDTFAAALVLRGRAYQICTLTEDGTTEESEPLPRPPRGLSVCGGSVCLLDSEELLLYDKTCRLTAASPHGASAMTVQAIDGGAMLFGDGEFMRCFTS